MHASTPNPRLIVRLAPDVCVSRAGDRGVTICDERTGARVDALSSVRVLSVAPLVPDLAHPDLAARFGLDRYHVIELAPEEDLAHSLSSLAAHRPLVQSAEKDAVTWAPPATDTSSPGGSGAVDESGTILVSDPLFSQQWPLENLGQTVDGFPGVPGADIALGGAWALQNDAQSVVVAVIDTGINAQHPDIGPALVPGFNTIGDPADTSGGNSSHGTHVAGIIGALTDNELGVTGVAPGVRIMPIRVFNSSGFGFESQFIQGLTWAADHGADIASMSLGYPSATSAMEDALEYANALGVVLVASTGNTPGQPVQYPAAFTLALAVGATNNRDQLWSNSTTGPEISLSAPGEDIISTWHTPTYPATYKLQSGTSMAVPHVSGVAALVLAANPDLSPQEVAWTITTTAKDLGAPGWDPQFGYGRIDAELAIASAIALGSDGCRVDFDGDGAFTLTDVELFVLYFTTQDVRADLAEPFGLFTSEDIGAFVADVSGSCS